MEDGNASASAFDLLPLLFSLSLFIFIFFLILNY